MDHDQLTTGDAHDIIQKTYEVLSGLQTFSPIRQVQCAAVLFHTLCRVRGMDPREMLNLADRIEADAEYHDVSEFRALRNYIKYEL